MQRWAVVWEAATPLGHTLWAVRAACSVACVRACVRARSATGAAARGWIGVAWYALAAMHFSSVWIWFLFHEARATGASPVSSVFCPVLLCGLLETTAANTTIPSRVKNTEKQHTHQVSGGARCSIKCRSCSCCCTFSFLETQNVK